MMVRPVCFAGNLETAASNAFQEDASALDLEELQRRALGEFDAMVEVLRAADVRVHVFEDTPEPHTPDSIFPNNWVSFHATGEVVLYPLLTPNRRAEVRVELVREVERESGAAWPELIDLTTLEETGAFLEGTGSMVLDRANRIAYACLSPRTTREGLDEFARRMNYELVLFRALDRGGVAIYHTNVVMGIGERFAVVCLDAIRDADERRTVEARLVETDHEVIELTIEQLYSFAGNCLAVKSTRGEPLIVLSEQALISLRPEQRASLAAHGRLLSTPLDTIESVGGGSARCMLAEIHEPS